ncbi:lamin tail domain-containing protein [bacterium]|nr:lamin tail domain-containing protein [bacterium]
MRERVFFIISLVFFLLLPSRILADIQLPELDTHHLLISIQRGIINEWIDITASEEFSEPEKQAALFLVRNAIQKRELSYAFCDLPLEVLERVAKLAAFLYFSPDVSQILDKIEKESVKKAVKDLTDWFLQNEIKVASGKLKDSFTSYKGNYQEIVFYYNLAYHSLDENSGELAVEFYSPNEIEPETGRGSIGGLLGFDWDFGTWRTQGKEKIPPFIVRIKGKVGRTLGDYHWDRTVSIEVKFNEKMPDFSQIEKEEDIRKIPFLGDYYFRIKNRIEKTKALVHRFGITKAIDNVRNKISKKGENIRNSIENILDKIQSYLSEINPFSPASIVETTPSLFISQGSYPQKDVQKQKKPPQESEQSIEESEQPIEEVEKEISTIEEKIAEVNPSNIKEKIQKGKSLEEIQEELDDIGERIDLINQQISNLLGQEKLNISSEETENQEKQETKLVEKPEIKQKESEEEWKKIEGIGQEEIGRDLLCPKPSYYVSPRQNRIVFNEIAWMGTSNSASDEWIELKNISNFSVDISGWQIFDKEHQIKIVFASGTVLLPKSFYLLERTDDNSVPNVKADFIYTGAINDTNEELYLFDEDCSLEDRIVVRSNWPAGNKKEKRSMERNKSGYGWHTYYGPAFNEVFGTPKRENSISPFSYIGKGSGSSLQEDAEPSISVSSSKIIITEVQIEGDRSSDDFVEFYNPSTSSVDISGFQLKKKTSLGKEYSIRVFPQGSVIPAEGYFLWVNSDYASSSGIDADATSSQTLAKNNSIALFDRNKNILDTVAWGSSTDPFVEGSPFSQNPGQRQTLARKWNEVSDKYQDTNDNSKDFELQESTPKKQNLFSENNPPIAVFEVSLSRALIGEEIFFNAASSTDIDGEIASFIWDFGDGHSTTTQTSTVAYSYATSGIFTAKLEVIDNNYSTSSPATTTIEIFSSFLKITPSIIEFDIEEGQNPLPQSLVLGNLSSTSTIWEAFVEYSTSSTSTDWIVLSSASGTIPAVASSTLEITPHLSGLSPGLYQATVFVSDGFVTSSIPINLTINSKPAPTLSVVINEIAWMGTKSDANDEWIELLNNTDEEVNLDGWQLYSQDGSPSTTLSGIIPANGYFLLERSDNQTISDIETDQIYTGAFSNNGEKLELRDSFGNLIDSVDCSSGWFSGRNRKIKERWIRMSMERINPQLSGDDPSNWMTNDGFNIFGHDSDGNIIQGTPKRENSRHNYSSGDFFHYTNDPLTHDTILTKEGSPYTFRGTFYISQDAILLIEPGVHIELVSDVVRRPSIEVQGTLIALGTSEKPIIFGPTGDCKAGSWRYIYLRSSGSIFDNVEIRCGGWYYYLPLTPVFYKGAIWIDNATATIRNSVFDSNLVAGVWLTNSDSVIEDSVFRNHNQNYGYGPPYKTSCGIRLEGSSNPVLDNLSFENNTYDIYPTP